MEAADEKLDRTVAVRDGSGGCRCGDLASGIATPACPETALLDWLEQLREPLKTLYNLEDEIVYIAWELGRWQEGLAPRERQALILLILSCF